MKGGWQYPVPYVHSTPSPLFIYHIWRCLLLDIVGVGRMCLISHKSMRVKGWIAFQNPDSLCVLISSSDIIKWFLRFLRNYMYTSGNKTGWLPCPDIMVYTNNTSTRQDTYPTSKSTNMREQLTFKGTISSELNESASTSAPVQSTWIQTYYSLTTEPDKIILAAMKS